MFDLFIPMLVVLGSSLVVWALDIALLAGNDYTIEKKERWTGVHLAQYCLDYPSFCKVTWLSLLFYTLGLFLTLGLSLVLTSYFMGLIYYISNMYHGSVIFFSAGSFFILAALIFSMGRMLYLKMEGRTRTPVCIKKTLKFTANVVMEGYDWVGDTRNNLTAYKKYLQLKKGFGEWYTQHKEKYCPIIRKET